MRNLIILLASVMALTAACADTRLPTATPNIPATIEAWQESVATAAPGPTLKPTATPRPTGTPTPIPSLSMYSDLPIYIVEDNHRGKAPFILHGCIAGPPLGYYGDSPRPRSYVLTFDGVFRRPFARAVVYDVALNVKGGCYNMAVQFEEDVRVGIWPAFGSKGALTPAYRLLTPWAFEQVEQRDDAKPLPR